MSQIKEVCGYKDLDGRFHDKLGDCEIANKRIEDRDIKINTDRDLRQDLYAYDIQVIIHRQYGMLNPHIDSKYYSFSEFVTQHPNAVFKAVIAIIRYNFKKQWNKI